MRNPRESEADIQRTIIDYLELHRFFFWRQNVGAHKIESENGGKGRFIRYGWPGLPDLFVIAGKRIVGIEVKAIDGEQSQAQFNFQVNFEKAGGIYILARSVDDVITALDIP